MLMHCCKTQSINYSWQVMHIGDKGHCETDCKMCWLKVHARGTKAVREYMSVLLQNIIDYKDKLAPRSFTGAPDTQQLTH